MEGLLGTADFAEPSATKRGDRLTGLVLYYALKLCGDLPKVGSRSEFVALLFDADGRLYAIEPERIQEVNRRSSVGH